MLDDRDSVTDRFLQILILCRRTSLLEGSQVIGVILHHQGRIPCIKLFTGKLGKRTNFRLLFAIELRGYLEADLFCRVAALNTIDTIEMEIACSDNLRGWIATGIQPMSR